MKTINLRLERRNMALETKEDLLIKHRYERSNAIFFLVLALIFSIAAYFSFSAQEVELFLASSVLAIFMLLAGLGQFGFRKKEFYIKGDKKRNTFEVNIGGPRRKNPILHLSKFRSFAFQIKTDRRYGTFYSIQIATDPKTWCEYYHKSEQKRQKYLADYKEMYLVFSFSSEQEDDAYQLIEFLEVCKIEETSFTPSVFGSYPGIPKTNLSEKQISSKKGTLSSVEKKMMVRQWLNYAFWIFLFSFCFLNLLLEFLGAFHGIYW